MKGKTLNPWYKGSTPTTQIVALATTAALYFVVSLIQIPSPVPNTSIALQFTIVALAALLYGPLPAAAGGFIGHIIFDAAFYGIWPSWEIATAVFGLVLGLLLLKTSVADGKFDNKDLARFILSVLVSAAIAWLLVAPVLDIVLMSEPANKVFLQGAFAFGSNTVVTAILGALIATLYAKSRTQSGSLSEEN